MMEDLGIVLLPKTLVTTNLVQPSIGLSVTLFFSTY